MRIRLEQLATRIKDRIILHHNPSSSPPPSPARSLAGRIRHRSQRHHQPRPPNYNRTTSLDVARFGLLSIATLPFSLWMANYSWKYWHRVELCRESLLDTDPELQYLLSTNSKQKTIGRQDQLNQVLTLLNNNPHQIIVVAGTNESGKSRFLTDILQSIPASERGITFLQLAQIVDSLSTLTQAFVKAFGLHWLDLRHALVDVLPVAGSEILVLKERYSDRDLVQGLLVVTEALKSSSKNNKKKPIIVMDGLGEGSGWIRSEEGQRTLQRLLKFFVYICKERQLAHIILTGNEELVLSLTDQNKMTRGHVQVIGLSNLSNSDAQKIIQQAWPDATQAEMNKMIGTFGGFIHDLLSVTRDIKYRLSQGNVKDKAIRARIVKEAIAARFRLQVERVTGAFAEGRDEEEELSNTSTEQDEDEEDHDPYLDPLKAAYSEAEASQSDHVLDSSSANDDRASWTQLQLWRTLQKLVESPTLSVSFADLRDEVFDGNKTPLLELMHEDVLGFTLDHQNAAETKMASSSSSSEQSWSWQVTPATPAIGRVFHHLVKDSALKERFQELELRARRREEISDIEQERKLLRREKGRLDLRKASLMKTVELGKELEYSLQKQHDLKHLYEAILVDEMELEQKGVELRQELHHLELQNNKQAQEQEGVSNTLSRKETVRNIIAENFSLQRKLKMALVKTFQGGRSKEALQRFDQAVKELGNEGAGLEAVDITKLIKATTGEDISLRTAKKFIDEWDLNNDRRLSKDEILHLLIADSKEE